MFQFTTAAGVNILLNTAQIVSVVPNTANHGNSDVTLVNGVVYTVVGTIAYLVNGGL